eukprot:m.397232 g.397232  ORF g.397232 m.397232 type:complete len:87 (+) comp16772_c3_seq52:1320-1580(+)
MEALIPTVNRCSYAFAFPQVTIVLNLGNFAVCASAPIVLADGRPFLPSLRRGRRKSTFGGVVTPLEADNALQPVSGVRQNVHACHH